MSLSSEMEKNSTEDDCADSGAETGGSDYSPMSSASSDLSMCEQQDPFQVSVHLIADPGQSGPLQRAADQVLSWVHPDLALFRVSERGAWQPRPKQRPLPRRPGDGQPQPALAVILFLQEDHGEDGIQRLHGNLHRPPWRYHHTERVAGRGMLPLSPACQDFFTLAPGTPLWAVRQVHYGKEIVRFTVYCRHESFGEQVRFYRLLLQRRFVRRKDDFCFCVIYANADTEIQLSFKRLPRGQSPATTECAVMELRVRDVGGLVPLLPRPCTPISHTRWQTEDYDGNKILLQVQGSWYRRRHTIGQFTHLRPDDSSPVPSPPPLEPAPPPPHGRGPVSYRNRRYHRSSSSSSHPRTQTPPPLPPASECSERPERSSARRDPEAFRAGWTGHRTRSLLSLPAAMGSPPSPVSAVTHVSPALRVNVDALLGAEETDVDTGRTLSGSAVDLSVVSAYSRPPGGQTNHGLRPRPLSAPPEERGPSPHFAEMTLSHAPYSSLGRTPFQSHAPLSPLGRPPFQSHTSSSSLGRPPFQSHTSSSLGRRPGQSRPPVPPRTSSVSASTTPCTQPKPRPHTGCLATVDSAPLGNRNGTAMPNNCSPEEEEEFYI